MATGRDFSEAAPADFTRLGFFKVNTRDKSEKKYLTALNTGQNTAVMNNAKCFTRIQDTDLYAVIILFLRKLDRTSGSQRTSYLQLVKKKLIQNINTAATKELFHYY